MLNPELLSKKLIGKTFISEIFYFEEIESTNNFAKQNSLPDNSLVITDHQFGGRGRFERKWESVKGKNLTFTIAKKINLKNSEQVNLIYSISNSIYETLLKYLSSKKNISADLHIKWPNDIMISDKKIAGILIETKTTTRNFVIGIGINVNQQNFKSILRTKATSLGKVLNGQTDLNTLLVSLLKRIGSGIKQLEDNNFHKIFNLWKKRLNNIGKKIRFIDSKGNIIEGILSDILSDGQIRIEQNGKITAYYSGEIEQNCLKRF